MIVLFFYPPYMGFEYLGHSNPPSPPHELSHLGLRPHEIRDLVRRGLWPRNPTDEDRGKKIFKMKRLSLWCFKMHV